MVKKAACVLGFLLIFIGLFHMANIVLYEKQHFGTAKNIAFEDKEKIDVFFIGASHIFYGVNPMEIWDRTGISGYNLTTHQQPLWASKLLLQHALKKQSPKLIVLDVLMATNFARPLLGTDQGTNMTHLVVDPVPLSLQKILGVMGTKAIRDKGEILFPVIINHSRLQQGLLSYDDFHFFSGDRSHPTKGYYYMENVLSYERPETVPDTVHELPDGMEDVLLDFIQFCRIEKIPLLLIKTPLVGNTELYEQINYIGEIAKEQGVPFLDFNRLYDEIAIDFQTDFADSGHLNVSGAQKVSRYLADYLAEEYGLPDHRGDSAYDSWERASIHYKALSELKNSTDIIPHLKAAAGDPNLLTVILFGGRMDEPVQLPDEVAAAFHEAGLSNSVPAAVGEGAYYAVIRAGKVVSEQSSPRKILNYAFMVKDKNFSLLASPRVPDGGSYMTALHIDKGGRFSMDPGILVVSYDVSRMTVIDAVRYAFDGTLSAEHIIK